METPKPKREKKYKVTDYDKDGFRDSISTIDSSGKRVWIYPKAPSGRFHLYRKVVAAFLLAFLFGAPFIKINGNPLLLFDVLSRRFVIFGQLFTPQDFHLFVLGMLLFIVFVVIFTVIFGRLFCGWVCPQTIFMEMVFRKIEYLIEGDAVAQKKLNKQAWDAEKIGKKTAKHSIFFGISFLISHTFLAYIVGVDELWQLFEDTPTEHLSLFVALLVFTGLFYGVFAFLREQVCTTICPYGRLQGVLLDNDSIVVAYDEVRGEPRGRGKREKDPIEREKDPRGDCVDCSLCVEVCPTGIDIRNGTQLECINCTACIDACDSIMDKFDLPRGLVRYASRNEIEKKQKFKFTTRMRAYSVVLFLLITAMVSLLAIRTQVETIVLRAQGTTYQTTEKGDIRNMFTVLLINKTSDTLNMSIDLEEKHGTIQMIGAESYQLLPEQTMKGVVLIDFPKDNLPPKREDIHLQIFSNGEKIETVKTKFLSPFVAN
ncbi:cytochrome c oxidase accessory protein CcoG [Bernardetia sp.]|uniref:cytochrome c oxidase accessory protein CcoG n=1 Tax=Bernardetia sp. TaxID=1937974 RepID=UPI0025C6D736|nr:cytochrome c oxidase accessory protein CcoG [Bernardetia sp.]